MKKISILFLVVVAALSACKKTPEVNLKYVDVERDLITVGTTTATVQCDYAYITTLKKAFFYYGEGTEEVDMNTAEMRVIQNTLYVDLAGLRENTTYCYYYEFVNGFNSMRSAAKTFKTEAGNGGGDEPPTPPEIMLPTVITASVTGITNNSARCGGEVTNDGGAEVTERGICWSTNENPTTNNSHVASGSGTGAFTAMMNGLEANTTYHVRAYAINEKGTAYGLNRELKTLSNGGGGSGEHEYVDLGLPSGTLWATCNLGANSPEEYGDYFAWGETTPKMTYNFSNYQHCHDGKFTKYCNDSFGGYDNYLDTLIVLLPEDDAATINWGPEWCMPTDGQFGELFAFTNKRVTYQNDIRGLLFTSNNGNSLFLPFAGYHVDENCYDIGAYFSYWSSVLDYTDSDLFDIGIAPNMALNVSAGDPEGCTIAPMTRTVGNTVRPVRSGSFQLPVVITTEVDKITSNSAVCRGSLINDGGNPIIISGFCWSTNPNPTIGDCRIFEGWDLSSLSAPMSGLQASTTYHVRAFATNVAGTAYGSEKTFTTLPSSSNGNHNYVDFGLPSGTLWATCNLGADTPEGYGDFFAWGETTPKITYNWSNYQYCEGNINSFTKYCNNTNYGFNGFTDNLFSLLPEDDAATANWGSEWYIPSEAQWRELINNTVITQSIQNGVQGIRLTAINGSKSIFLPAAGFHWDNELCYCGTNYFGLCCYWSKSLTTNYPYHAGGFHGAELGGVEGSYRGCGYPIRPVRNR
ncbi:MAG: hypothetical protein IKU00_05905 [Bacteroidales bacterium]|nr:hypothetical protein [Bacteroidales bacterium]